MSRWKFHHRRIRKVEAMYTVSQVKGFESDGTVRMGCLTSACQGCKASMFCNNKDVNEFFALNPKKVQLKEGDLVELYMPPGKTILSTALVFALPLILFPVGYLVMRAALPSSSEIIHALGGFGAMAISFGVAAVISTVHRRNLMPTVIRIMAKAEDPV